MMKRMIIIAAVALVASSAMAGNVGQKLSMIPPVGVDTASSGRALTSDGKYVVGLSGTAVGFSWEVGSPTAPIAIVGGGAWSFTTATGLGYRNVGGVKELVAHGMSAGYSSTVYSTNGGAYWEKGMRATVGVGSAPGIGAASTLGALGVDDSWYSGWKSDSTSSATMYVEKVNGSPPALVSRDSKGTTQTSGITGTSGTGKAVGMRKGDGTNNYNTRWQYNGTGGATQTYFNGLSGNSFGQAWAVSADGNKIFGMSAVSGGRTGNWPYMRDEVANTIVELPRQSTLSGSVTNALPYGASADGRWAVGMDYQGMERAVLWDTLNMKVIDLTKYAIANNILDGFTGNLRRGYSVGVNAQGQPVVTGQGVWYAKGSTVAYTRGFVLTVPEPGTMAFLVLGGLALLRRRR